MISIITAVYNQLEMNKLFLEYLNKNTFNDFELIIIDNGSIDGTRDFFKEKGVIVIENDGNYSYPYCQNRGIEIAKSDYLCFLNNDIIVSKDWDKRILENMEFNGLEVATTCGVERLENKEITKKYKRKWQKIKSIIGVFGRSEKNLKLMHKIMYLSWDKFCNERYLKFKNKAIEGFVGNTVIIKRSALDKIGMWDERIQGADFDLYMRTRKRFEEVGDIKPCHIALDVFNHHYIRLTFKTKYPPFKDKENLISLEEKWEKKYYNYCIKEILKY